MATQPAFDVTPSPLWCAHSEESADRVRQSVLRIRRSLDRYQSSPRPGEYGSYEAISEAYGNLVLSESFRPEFGLLQTGTGGGTGGRLLRSYHLAPQSRLPVVVRVEEGVTASQLYLDRPYTSRDSEDYAETESDDDSGIESGEDSEEDGDSLSEERPMTLDDDDSRSGRSVKLPVPTTRGNALTDLWLSRITDFRLGLGFFNENNPHIEILFYILAVIEVKVGRDFLNMTYESLEDIEEEMDKALPQAIQQVQFAFAQHRDQRRIALWQWHAVKDNVLGRSFYFKRSAIPSVDPERIYRRGYWPEGHGPSESAQNKREAYAKLRGLAERSTETVHLLVPAGDEYDPDFKTVHDLMMAWSRHEEYFPPPA